MLTFLPLDCGPDITVEVFIGSMMINVNASGRICFPGLDDSDILFHFSPGEGDFFKLHRGVAPNQSDYNSRRFSTIVILSDQEVSVYGHEECRRTKNTASAFRVSPVDYLGTEYRVTVYWLKGESQIGIAATEEGLTVINIHHDTIGSWEVTLRQYEGYYYGGFFDITGTHIIADKVIL